VFLSLSRILGKINAAILVTLAQSLS
jgi:hypothetical protein